MRQLFAFLCLLIPACGGSHPPLATVDAVDLDRYMGTWYEIMRLPNSFQKNCWNSTAEYSLMDDGKVRVVNRCRKDSVSGPVDSATGKAWVVEGSNNSKLKVSFFWPFRGDYWIIELDEDYQWVAVGAPSREYLWILARKPRWDAVPLETLKERLAEKGFDVAQLVATNDYPLAILDAAPPRIQDVEEE